MRQQECASEGIIEERECRLGQGYTVIDMHQPLIATTVNVVKKSLEMFIVTCSDEIRLRRKI